MMGFLRPAGDTAPSRARMIAPFAILLVVLAIYTVYWMYAAGQVRGWTERWIESQEAVGYDIDHARMRVGGYPLRFTLDVAAPEIAAPQGEGGWQARFDRLSASAMPWNFNHWIVTLGGPMTLAVEADGAPALYRADAADARLSINSSGEGTQRIGIELENLVIDTIDGPVSPVMAMQRLDLTGILNDADELSTRFEAQNVRFSAGTLEPELAAAFGPTASLVRFDGAVTAWSALATEGDARDWARSGGELRIGAAQLVWGPASLGGTGEIQLDTMLRPAGRLSVVISDPESLVEAMVEARLVQSGQGVALRLAAMMAPRRDGGVALPLRFQDGGIFLGPARIGSVGAID